MGKLSSLVVTAAGDSKTLHSRQSLDSTVVFELLSAAGMRKGAEETCCSSSPARPTLADPRS